MPHIHTEPGHHDLTASAYIFRTDGSEPMILLHVHRLLHKYLQFGGHVELHEHLWAAVIHEIREESGYDISQLQLLQPPHTHPVHTSDSVKAHPLPFSLLTHRFGNSDHFHTDAAYALVTDQAPKHSVGDGESGELKTFTRNELAALSSDNIPENVQTNALFVFDDILGNWETVVPSSYPI